MQEPQESISIETSQILAAQAKLRGLTVDVMYWNGMSFIKKN